MTKETEYILQMYEAADDESKDIMRRIIAILFCGSDEAREILYGVERSLTLAQMRERLEQAEAIC